MSNITFTPNIKKRDRKGINTSLGLDGSLPHDTYFGLPTVIGGNKRKVFAAIKDRVWKRIKS